MEQYQILISFNKNIAEFGKPLTNKKEAQKKANKLLNSIKPKSKFNLSIIIEKRIV